MTSATARVRQFSAQEQSASAQKPAAPAAAPAGDLVSTDEFWASLDL